jgi:hypothetical protein
MVPNLTVPYSIRCPGMQVSLKKSSETAKKKTVYERATYIFDAVSFTYIFDAVSFNNQNVNRVCFLV